MKLIETKESCMEAFRNQIALKDRQIVGTPHWRTLDLDCMEISSRCMKLGGDKKVLTGMLRNEKTKLPETPEERFYALEKRMTELELRFQERPESIEKVTAELYHLMSKTLHKTE